MENKKQAAIRKAYGSSYEVLKPFIDEDGWYKWSDECPVSLVLSEFDYNKQTDSHRPKSLKGIKNNNGWIAIDNEIKVDNGKYWVRLFNPDTNIESFEVINVLHGVIDYYFATHYQPIVKPSPPIY